VQERSDGKKQEQKRKEERNQENEATGANSNGAAQQLAGLGSNTAPARKESAAHNQNLESKKD
jgi:hypothetical protein